MFEEIFNQGRFEVANEIYAPDFKNHGLHSTADLKEDQEAVHAEKKAFPDLRMRVERLVAEGVLGNGIVGFFVAPIPQQGTQAFRRLAHRSK